MKRLPIVFIALALMAASCAPSNKAKPRLGLAMRSFDDPVSVVIRGTIETAALDKAELAIIDGQNQQSAQNLQIDSLFDTKLKAIAINPIDGFSLGPVIEKAKKNQVPIVFFGLEPSDEWMRSWDKLFFVGSRQTEAGTAQGEILSAYWKSGPAADRNKDGSLQYVSLTAVPLGQDAGAQAEAATKAMNAAGIRTVMLASESAAGGDSAARRKMASLLGKYGDKIEAVICDDDETALGAIDALKAAGFDKGKKRMPVVGAGEGELPEAVAAALASGSLLGTAHTDTVSQGKAVFDLAYALARGASPARSGWRINDAKYVWVPWTKFTKGNLPAKN
jgi:methyl-galactoside transport system substrate-binding protein